MMDSITASVTYVIVLCSVGECIVRSVSLQQHMPNRHPADVKARQAAFFLSTLELLCNIRSRTHSDK